MKPLPRWWSVPVLAVFWLSACGKEPPRSGPAPETVSVRHRALREMAPRSAVLVPKSNLWVVIHDANPLIYDYRLSGQSYTEDQAARDAFRRLFALRDVSTMLQPQRVAGTGDPCDGLSPADTVAHFECLARSVAKTSEILLGAIQYTDSATEAPTKVAQEVQNRLEAIPEGIRDFLLSEEILKRELSERYGRIPSPRAEVQALHSAVSEAVPAVVLFNRELRTLRLGLVEIPYSYQGDGDKIIELRITNRLGEAYRPQRTLSDSGLYVARIKPLRRGFEVSTGIAFVGGERAQFRLEKLNADTLKVVGDTVRDVSFPPSAFLTYLFPLRGAPKLGPSFGVGVGGDLKEIQTNTDLLGGLTFAHEWFRFTVGTAYTSEIHSIPGLGEDSRTTDPNILDRASRSRKWRFMIAGHANIQ